MCQKEAEVVIIGRKRHKKEERCSRRQKVGEKDR
jgi:hypothetical protein